jgi:hypothetical protein
VRSRRRAAAWVAATTLLCGVVAGCVDHGSNAQRFCDRNVELLDPSQDGQTLSEDQAVYFSDEVEKTMRFAEDGTRELRRTARKLADAYADIRGIAGDDDVPKKEIQEKYAELNKQRVATRDVCGELTTAREA